MKSDIKHKVLFVCLGNICRSPTAQGVFESLVKDKGISGEFLIDSAGTHGYHVGRSPDPRSTETAMLHGIDISSQKCRQVHEVDFEIFDLVIAMDSSNYENLINICPREYHHKVTKLLKFSENKEIKDVPDPYHFSDDGFEDVYEIIRSGCVGLLQEIR